MRKYTLWLLLVCAVSTLSAQPSGQRRGWRRTDFQTDTLMVHDPVMAFENGKYYIFSTGMGIQMATSTDRRTWTVHARPVFPRMPEWTHDSVPGFRGHTWAPDVIHYRGRWWIAYSCSTFGRNTSAIGIASSATLDPTDSLNYGWTDHGCVVASQAKRDQWNAIDPAIVLDDEGRPWMAWGSFWDGIQLQRLDSTMHLDPSSDRKTVARRVALADTLKAEPNPTSKYAGRNAIEAPFIMRHDGYYYLFVSHDYCCRGKRSNYKVVVGRSRDIAGPYLDRLGRDMASGGGTLVIEGDKVEFEAAGHCAAYSFADGDLFVCHGYSVPLEGQSILVQRRIQWTEDGWPQLN